LISRSYIQREKKIGKGKKKKKGKKENKIKRGKERKAKEGKRKKKRVKRSHHIDVYFSHFKPCL